MATRRNYPKVLARIDGGAFVNATGREGLTLLTLVERGADGVSGLDFPGGPAYRLAAYVCDLRGMGIGIRTETESHGIGHHARYFLTTPVRVVRIDRGEHSGRAA